MNTAERLSDMITDAVNGGNGRNIVTPAQVAVMAASLGFHRVRNFADKGERFLAFSFPADESELVISADPDPVDEALAEAIAQLETVRASRLADPAKAIQAWHDYRNAVADYESLTGNDI